MATYVGRWDCTSCGYKGVEGPKTACTNCGSPRPKNVKFYLADKKDIVQDPEVLKKARTGADWVCSYCSGHNKAYQNTCTTCGNDREIKDGDKSLQVKNYSLRDTPTTGDNYRPKEKQPVHPELVEEPPKRGKWGCLIAIGVFLLLFFMLGYTSETTATVAGFEWERIISVEHNIEVIEEDWSVPTGGRMLSSHQAIHHYNRILDHYETRTRTVQVAVGTEQYVCGTQDMGNGYFQDKYCSRTVYESQQETYEEPVYRKEPVYMEKYRYAIFRWKPAPSIRTHDNNQQPLWGNTSHIETDKNKRIANREGTYTLIVMDEYGEEHQHPIPLERWQQLNKGDIIKARKGLFGGYRGLDKSF